MALGVLSPGPEAIFQDPTWRALAQGELWQRNWEVRPSAIEPYDSRVLSPGQGDNADIWITLWL